MRRLSVVTPVLVLLVVSGCSKIDHTQTLVLEAGESHKALAFDPPRNSQKVTVTAEVGDVPMNVYVVKADSAKEANEIVEKKEQDKILAEMKEEKGSISLEATIPAKQVFAVVLERIEKGSDLNTKKREVKLTVKGR